MMPELDHSFRTLQAGRSQTDQADPLLLWAALALLLLGIVMVYSASIAIAEASRYTGYQSNYFLLRQSGYVAVGLILGIALFRLPSSVLQKLALPAFIVGVILLLLVLIPHVGLNVKGSQRWLPLGITNLQPSEFMKLLAVLYAADYTQRKLKDMDSFRRGFLPLASVILLVGFLLLLQPDFGAFVVVAAIAFGILFLGGVNLRVFALLVVVALIGFAMLIWFEPYRRERLLGFMDPWQDELGRSYQLSHSLIAFGRGGILGVGLGASVEKLFYLPETHTDFLLAVIAEELGLVGVFTVIILFAVVIQRCFAIGRMALRLERLWSSLVAQGIGIWLGVQSFINMGVNMGLLPTKGLTLPLMSYGGSGIVANCLGLAVLLRIDYENRMLRRGVHI